jgi:hypothetical protein
MEEPDITSPYSSSSVNYVLKQINKVISVFVDVYWKKECTYLNNNKEFEEMWIFLALNYFTISDDINKSNRISFNKLFPFYNILDQIINSTNFHLQLDIKLIEKISEIQTKLVLPSIPLGYA